MVRRDGRPQVLRIAAWRADGESLTLADQSL
jgi:hypothetical protein